MHTRITDRARQVILLANDKARRFNHEYVGTEHLLLGLISSDAGVGVAANVLKNLDIDPTKIRQELEGLCQRGLDKVATDKLPWTPRAKKSLECAEEEARSMNHEYLGTEHLLIGLLREEESVAAQILLNVGAKLRDIRQEVLNILGSGLSTTERFKLDTLSDSHFWEQSLVQVHEKMRQRGNLRARLVYVAYWALLLAIVGMTFLAVSWSY